MKFLSSPQSQSSQRPSPFILTRRGYGIVEVIVCMIMLGSLATWLIPLLNTVTTKRAELFERARLQQVTMNIVEKLSATPFNPSTFQASSDQLIESAKASKATLTLTAGLSNPQGLRRIDLTVAPLDSARPIRLIKLTTWLKEANHAN